MNRSISVQKDSQKIGEVLKQLRLQLGLTQAEVAQENSLNYICTERHLRKIEKGVVSPSATILNQLLMILGVSLEEFTHLVYGQNHVNFTNSFEAVWSLFYDENYVEAQNGLDRLKDNFQYDKTVQHFQSVLLCEAVLLKRLSKDLQGCLEVSKKSLCMTSPMVLDKHGAVVASVIAGKTFSKNEYRLINVIANAKLAFGQPREAIDIFKALLLSLNLKDVNHDIKKEVMPSVFFNLSNTLSHQNIHEEALKVCEDGIAFCTTVKSFKAIGKLHYNKARELFYMSNHGEAEKSFNLSYNTFLCHNDLTNANHVKKIAKDKFDITIYN